MFEIVWFDKAGKMVDKVMANSLEQAKQKIRATISRKQFQSDIEFKLNCPTVDHEDLDAFIESEMANSAARVDPTLEP